jgi:4-amino-4-deoxy-L-arabinose transferase-like glycosyltransferase
VTTPRIFERVRGRVCLHLDALLFALALVLFLVTRLWALERFPISFFGDEAIQSVTAADLIRDGFWGQRGELLPTFFENGGAFNLAVSVYAQVVPHALFGFSIFVTRATSVLIALTGVAAVALILRDAFRVRAWWVGALVLSMTPAWFLHSRTAFETVLAVAFYAWFLFGYLRYRSGSTPWLYAAVVAAALAFYSYAPMQVVVVSSAALLLLSDFGHHRRHARTLLGGLALAAVLSLPYVRFVYQHGFDASRHLHALHSYLVDPDLGTRARLGRFVDEYAQGLSPSYWYDPDAAGDLLRHRMKNYGHLLLATLPFLLAGVAVCLARFRSFAHRALLIALVCAPLGGALAGTNVTRDLVIVVPAALLTALGIDLALRPLGRIPWPYVAVALFTVLGAWQTFMLRDALANGPTWYRNYGLHGMQFGGRQVGAAVRRHLDSVPEARVAVSPTWANNTGWIIRLVTHDDDRVRTDSIESWRFEKLPIPSELAFVVTRNEYETIRRDARFTSVEVFEVVEYPDGRPGFYLLRLGYSEAAEEIFAREKAARRRAKTETISVEGVLANVTYPHLSHGRVADLFDGDSFTLARTLETNPFVVRIAFPAPHELTGIEVALATMQPHVTVKVTELGHRAPLVFRQKLDEVRTEPRLSIPFSRTLTAVAVEVAVRDVGRSGDDQVHIAELAFLS